MQMEERSSHAYRAGATLSHGYARLIFHGGVDNSSDKGFCEALS
jgi:hypothetical protein